jgi:hypothetical protein
MCFTLQYQQLPTYETKFVVKPHECRQLDRQRDTQMDNIKMFLREVGCEILNCVELVQDISIDGFCVGGFKSS